jgi:hypothetical protein
MAERFNDRTGSGCSALTPSFARYFFEDNIHCVDDLLARVFFAINDNFVLQRRRTIKLHLVVLSEAIIPAAIPNRQIISVLLKRIGGRSQVGA